MKKLLIVALTVGLVGYLHANQESSRYGTRSDPVYVYDTQEESSPSFIYGVKYTTPQKFSVMIGLESTSSSMGWSSSGSFVAIEPGIGGGKLHLGYFEGQGFGGLLMKLSLLRTWGAPLDFEPDQTYVGAELTYSYFLVSLTGGGYVHVAGDDDEHDFIFSGGIGLGF